MKFEIVESPDGNLTWWLVDENGAVLARALSTYKNPDNLNKAIQTVRTSAQDALVVDMTGLEAAQAV